MGLPADSRLEVVGFLRSIKGKTLIRMLLSHIVLMADCMIMFTYNTSTNSFYNEMCRILTLHMTY